MINSTVAASFQTLKILNAGLQAHSFRQMVAVQNLVNASTLPATPDDPPYLAKIPIIENAQGEGGLTFPTARGVLESQEECPRVFMPDHPGADEQGMVRMSNVNREVELMNCRDAELAQRTLCLLYAQHKNVNSRIIDLMNAI